MPSTDLSKDLLTALEAASQKTVMLQYLAAVCIR